MHQQGLKDNKKNKIPIHHITFKREGGIHRCHHETHVFFTIQVKSKLNQKNNSCYSNKSNVGSWLPEYFKQFNFGKPPHVGLQLSVIKNNLQANVSDG